jgi:hypothetical protein
LLAASCLLFVSVQSSEASSCVEHFKKCTSIRTQIQGPYGTCEERLANCKQTGTWANQFGEEKSTRK